MKKLILIISIFLIVTTAYSQYDKAIGFRAGVSSGLVFKSFIGPRDALDGWLTFNDGYVISAQYLYHTKNHNIKIEIANLAFFIGAGVYGKFITTPEYGGNKRNKFGISGTIGVEYKIPYIPFILNVDLKPNFPILNHEEIDKDYDLDMGIAIRYIF